MVHFMMVASFLVIFTNILARCYHKLCAQDFGTGLSRAIPIISTSVLEYIYSYTISIMIF